MFQVKQGTARENGKKETRRSRRKSRQPITPAIVPDSPPSPPKDQSPPKKGPKTKIENAPLVATTPRSPLPAPARSCLWSARSKTPKRRVGLQLQPWKLKPISLPPLRHTRPPRIYINQWDVRIWRFTSPSFEPMRLFSPVSPLPATPSPKRDQGSQTAIRAISHKEIQHAPTTSETGTQTDLWATITDDEPEVLLGDDKWGPI